MSSLLAESGLTWTDLLRTWNELEVPKGWRPEITPAGIFITPPPSGFHHLIGATVNRALVTATDQGLGIFQSLGVGIPSIGGVFIPDLCVVDRDHVPLGGEPVDALS